MQCANVCQHLKQMKEEKQVKVRYFKTFASNINLYLYKLPKQKNKNQLIPKETSTLWGEQVEQELNLKE